MNSKREVEQVLIVEDSPTQAEKLKFLLEKNGYQVLTANNGKDALTSMNVLRSSVVITDVVMPEMDGYELCRCIKEDELLNNIPVILLTELSDSADVLRGLECGADSFITKPYDEKYLLSRIQYLLANKLIKERDDDAEGIEIIYGGSRYHIKARRQQILNLLISTYETAISKNTEFQKARDELRILNEDLEKKVEQRTEELITANEQLQKDISIRKLAEAQYRSIFENAVEGIFQIEIDGRILSVNPAFASMLGYASPRELMEEVADMRQFYVDARQRDKIIDLIQKNGIIMDFEVKFCCKNKKEIICSISAHRIDDPVGKFVGLEGMVVDITERKRAGEALMKSEALLRETQHLAKVGGWEYDMARKIITWSDEVYRIYGVPDDFDPNDKKIETRFYTPEDRAALDLAFNKAVNEGIPYDIQMKFINARGTHLWVRNMGKAEKKDGRIVRIFGNIMDVTDITRVQEELRKLNEELDRRVRDRTAEIEKKNDELERFNKLFVGRELRMIELKDRITALETEIAGYKNKKDMKELA